MIKCVSFDVDGTLLDQEYNDLVWLEEVPRLYSETKGIDYPSAYEYVKGEFDRVGQHDLRWYDLGYWLRTFELPSSPEEVLDKFVDRIRVFPEVEKTFQLLAGYGMVVVTAMPRDFLSVKMRKLNGSFDRVFSTVTDFKSVKTPEVYSRVCRKLGLSGTEVLHVGDLWEADYLAPKASGMHALCIDRSGERRGEGVIKSLQEIPVKIEEIHARP